MPSKARTTTTVLTPARSGHRNFQRRIADRTRTHWFDWRHLRCKATETPDFGNPGWTLLQLDIIAARDTPCPITTTGYLAHGIDARELSAAGGAVDFFTAWMDREACTKRFQKILYAWRQGDLVDLLQLSDEDRQP